MATLGDSGDVLHVSDYDGGGRGGARRGGGAPPPTWDGLEPVSNTALDEFAPMEEVADDEIDYRIRSTDLVRCSLSALPALRLPAAATNRK
jgi:hypothetical protein